MALRIVTAPGAPGGLLLAILLLAGCGEDRISPARPRNSTGLGGNLGGNNLDPTDAGQGGGGGVGGSSPDAARDATTVLPTDGPPPQPGPDAIADRTPDAPVDAAIDAAVDSSVVVAPDSAVDSPIPVDLGVDRAPDVATPAPDLASPAPDVARDVAPPPPDVPAPAPDLARDLAADSPVPPDMGPDLAPAPDLAPRDTGGGSLPAFCASYPPAPGGWQSAHLTYVGGRLSYPADAEQNRIPDFSYAGYKYGQVALPDVPEVMRLDPAVGDNTQRLQAALDAVGARPLDSRGLRGALVLGPGRYEVAGTLRVNRAGVVLRGAGDGADPNVDTIIVATGDVPHQRTVIVAGSGSRSWSEGNPRANVTTPFVQVSALSFDVASTAGFSVGDAVVVRHPSTQAWIDALGGGGVVTSPPWTPGSRDLIYHRFIRGISGNTLTLDAPVFNHLNAALSQASVARASSMPYISQVGVENLRIDIQTAGGEDENHAWTGLSFQGAIDSWARKVTALHFGWAGLEADGATRITMDQSTAIEPVGIRTGGRFYNFAMEGLAQLVLVQRCHAADGRHSLVGSGAHTTSGNVFYRCTLTRGGSNEGGHRQWTQAILFDNITESATGSINLINRGDYGTSHGWGCVHSVIWGFNSRLVAQKPPTGQNYAISPAGQKGGTPPFPGPDGVYELKGPGLSPASLYEAQLCDRLTR